MLSSRPTIALAVRPTVRVRRHELLKLGTWVYLRIPVMTYVVITVGCVTLNALRIGRVTAGAFALISTGSTG